MIRERYLKEPFNRRLGHLASDLLRVSTFLENPAAVAAVSDIIEEAKYFMEWAAHDAPTDIQAILSEMQSRLALYQLRLMRKKEESSNIEDLRKTSKSWSFKLIEISGLLTT